MLPLIDIVFLLLVFFIYAMLSMAVHRGLPVLLPTSSSAEIDKELLLSITVKSDGTVYVDKDQIDIDDLESFLKAKTISEKKSASCFLLIAVFLTRIFSGFWTKSGMRVFIEFHSSRK